MQGKQAPILLLHLEISCRASSTSCPAKTIHPAEKETKRE
jgi:hypothetical protein